ncbi:hypothetical protein H0H92_004120 [Tricholoma furcatifolium]|nr:hypothetical protein H0H92_004120 [Tricholoma furcatifolium]
MANLTVNKNRKEDERIQYLEDDEWIITIHPHKVNCRGCDDWICLDNHYTYYPSNWEKHRHLCQGIEKLNGGPVPKVKHASQLQCDAQLIDSNLIQRLWRTMALVSEEEHTPTAILPDMNSIHASITNEGDWRHEASELQTMAGGDAIATRSIESNTRAGIGGASCPLSTRFSSPVGTVHTQNGSQWRTLVPQWSRKGATELVGSLDNDAQMLPDRLPSVSAMLKDSNVPRDFGPGDSAACESHSGRVCREGAMPPKTGTAHQNSFVVSTTGSYTEIHQKKWYELTGPGVPGKLFDSADVASLQARDTAGTVNYTTSASEDQLSPSRSTTVILSDDG